MNHQHLAAILITLFAVAGCGPTRTVGTKGLAARDLSVLSIAQLSGEAPVKIHAIRFDDGGDLYKIGNGRDFYLRPGDHAASFTLIARVPGPGGWFVPSGALTFQGPKNIPLGTFMAGRAYELAPTVDAFDNLLHGGGLAMVQEKAK
jgi:hypothetical protein